MLLLRWQSIQMHCKYGDDYNHLTTGVCVCKTKRIKNRKNIPIGMNTKTALTTSQKSGKIPSSKRRRKEQKKNHARVKLLLFPECRHVEKRFADTEAFIIWILKQYVFLRGEGKRGRKNAAHGICIKLLNNYGFCFVWFCFLPTAAIGAEAAIRQIHGKCIKGEN